MALGVTELPQVGQVLGGDIESARALDPEHVALAGVLALLTGADELYAARDDAPAEGDEG